MLRSGAEFLSLVTGAAQIPGISGSVDSSTGKTVRSLVRLVYMPHHVCCPSVRLSVCLSLWALSSKTKSVGKPEIGVNVFFSSSNCMVCQFSVWKTKGQKVSRRQNLKWLVSHIITSYAVTLFNVDAWDARQICGRPRIVSAFGAGIASFRVNN